VNDSGCKISAPTSLRLGEKTPKGAFDLWKYRVLNCGPLGLLVPFGSWADSMYVHGHGRLGRFVFDDGVAQTVLASRLLGFHDSFKRHYGKDYTNSWAVLPQALPKLLERRWTEVTTMLDCQVIAFDDADLRRRQPGAPGLEDEL
jgi:hypothetical protein